MRKYYLDNIRSLIILWLVPFHTLSFYLPVFDGSLSFPNTPNSVLAVLPQFLTGAWIMPLLFVCAGMTTFYSLRRRTYRQYLTERVKKLLIPAVAGWFIVIPGVVYIPKLASGTTESFPAFYRRYVFSPSIPASIHLWFLLVLFVVSLIALPLIMLTRKRGWSLPAEKLTLPVLIALAVPLLLLGTYGRLSDVLMVTLSGALLFFLFGYYVFACDGVVERLKKRRWWLFGAFLLLSIGNLAVCFIGGINTTYGFQIVAGKPMQPWFGLLVSWAGILAVMGLSAKYLEFHNRATAYMAQASFAFYIFHYLFIMLLAWWITSITGNALIQFPVILLGATVLTLGFYELIRRIPGVRFLFGIGAPKK